MLIKLGKIKDITIFIASKSKITTKATLQNSSYQVGREISLSISIPKVTKKNILREVEDKIFELNFNKSKRKFLLKDNKPRPIKI